MRLKAHVVLLLLLIPALAGAKAIKLDDYHWNGVERVVAIGDLHGDFDQYLNVMRSAGLLDAKGKWAGGKTHLVQTGDLVDRGADSRKIIDHLLKLAKQAKKKGGYVHMLIGNHETMNVTGDLRYVSAGEFRSYTTRNSQRLQDMQWQRQLDWMGNNDSEAFESLDLDTYRIEWLKRVPLGWVEHRQAWSPGGRYYKRVAGNRVAIRLNDTLFVHAGISAKYCKFSLQSLTEQVIAALQHYDPAVPSIIDDDLGPVWYRGLAMKNEEGVFIQTLDNILKRYGVRRIVVGHTPTGGVIWPRFDQRVIVNDAGISAYYGANTAALELTADGAVAIYGDQRIPVPTNNAGREAYLRAVMALRPDNALLKKRLDHMLTPPVEAPVAAPETSAGEKVTTTMVEEEKPAENVMTGVATPGICQ